MKKKFTVLGLLLPGCFLLHAQNQITLVPYSSGYTSPLGIENCGDSRLFVVQQTGQIMICDSAGNRRTTPFLDISDRISPGGERGLLGLAFDPDYLSNGFFYVNYTDTNGNTQISRFKVSAGNPNRAVKSSEKFILGIIQPFANHNGGCIRFGPDGYLYIGMGDGGSAGDPNNNAQNPMSLLGKMLRINVHHGNPYSIPRSNPFVDSANYKHEIWALGLRNPWRWSFDALTGALIIADVGQMTWEEVDLQEPGSKGGQNYGWRCYEGNHPYNTNGCKSQSSYTFPKYEYQHLGGDCSITGGFVYRGDAYPLMYGKYFCADYCSGIIRALYMSGASIVEKDVYDGASYAFTTFGEDRNHELYVNDITNGLIYRITGPSSTQQTTVTAVNLVSIIPNPSNGNFVLTCRSEKLQQLNIRIENIMGRQFYTTTENINAGTSKLNMNLHLPAGDYHLVITDASGNVISRQLIFQ